MITVPEPELKYITIDNEKTTFENTEKAVLAFGDIKLTQEQQNVVDKEIDTAIKEKVKLVGLSALMTTTVVNMEETIRLLRKRYPECKVMVGGAVMTQDYADRIGADSYAKDAMGAVRYAERLFSDEQ